ncbi:DUF4249 domain-containing protein [Hymenobacter swuensis]|uniref:DUF4249 domain-containing protein n=1 Tax=Hymenobacter swuensis DY53 TaxID=1227739 RepID=W8F8D6_9BACT|nr:DUF4249 domain-containing protein [Hymenobacter swuensis]AHJ98886.1 hypothetical protein Hsw_3291 [Hymenobacter swuensis DY53]
MALGLTACVEPFEPKVDADNAHFLVVDGNINSQGVTVIHLTRSVNLRDPKNIPVETRAKMFIEEESGTRYPLLEAVSGTYTSASLKLTPSRRARLHFTTAGQKEYVSEFTLIQHTPAIDSVSWRTSTKGMQLYVNTHDASNQARYYRWAYDETWEFTSAFVSTLKYERAKIVERANEDIHHCWASESSSDIRLGTTEKLAQAVVADFPLTLLPPTSKKLQRRYSILVKQYALTKEEYTYWDILRKNTETLGTLFDPLPSQSVGNVRSLTDASEVVLGFVGAQSVTEKRIFIDYGELPRTWVAETGYETCHTDTLLRPKGEYATPPPSPAEVVDFFRNGLFIPLEDLQQDPLNPTRFFLFASADCVDCRKRGTNVKPSFWP